jgi:hypothetical protein
MQKPRTQVAPLRTMNRKFALKLASVALVLCNSVLLESIDQALNAATRTLR